MSSSRFGALAAAVLALCLVSSCTHDDDKTDAGKTTDPIPATTTTAPAVTLTRPNAPLDVTIAQVGGGVRAPQRAALIRAISKPLGAWINGGFLGADYPRGDFSAGFASWTPRAAALGARDRDITTNAALGRDIVAVVADRRQVRLYVFASHERAGGATARVVLGFTAERQGGAKVHFVVTGSVYLTRDGSKWRIFGYDLNRTVAR